MNVCLTILRGHTWNSIGLLDVVVDGGSGNRSGSCRIGVVVCRSTVVDVCNCTDVDAIDSIGIDATIDYGFL